MVYLKTATVLPFLTTIQSFTCPQPSHAQLLCAKSTFIDAHSFDMPSYYVLIVPSLVPTALICPSSICPASERLYYAHWCPQPSHAPLSCADGPCIGAHCLALPSFHALIVRSVVPAAFICPAFICRFSPSFHSGGSLRRNRLQFKNSGN